MVCRVIISVRRCYRFSGLYAFHSSGDVAVGIRRPRIVVLMAYKAAASSTLALLQCVGHWGCHICSKSTSESDTIVLEGGVRRGGGPRLLLLMVRLLTERYHRALSRWKYYALCSHALQRGGRTLKACMRQVRGQDNPRTASGQP